MSTDTGRTVGMVCGFDRAWPVGACPSCGIVMVGGRGDFCPDCRERLAYRPTKTGGKGKPRGPRR